MRAPDAPIGCPIATAPPLTFTRSSSIPSMRIEFRVTEANASLISHRSMSPGCRPALSSAFSAALAGVRASHSKSSATAAWAMIVASTSRPSRSAHSSEANTIAPAPSLTPGELPAVCEPSLPLSPGSEASALQRRVAPRRLVDLDHGVALPALDRHRDDLLRQATVVGGGDRALVRAQRPLVEVRAGHLELLADLGRLLEHLLARERVAQAVLDHRVERLHVAHAEAEARLREQVRRLRHRLHAAADRQRRGRRRAPPGRSSRPRGCPTRRPC